MEARERPESEVSERAPERGIGDRREDLTPAQYRDAEIDGEEAIDRVGRTNVERARAVVEEAVDWGLNA